jgi:nucleotide-binding universal stress UspA family protein
MPSLARILLPVDFSGRSGGAARVAQALAARFGSEITVLHVVTPPPYEFSALEDGASVLAEAYSAHARQASQDLQTHLAAGLEGVPVRRVVVEGDPARKIVELAHQEGMNLIVMPTHGHGPFRRFILGSVTAKVLHDADCAVMTGVHLERPPAPESLRFRRIVAAVDLGPQSGRTLEWAAWLAANLDAELAAVHVTPGAAPQSGEASAAEASRRRLEQARQQVAGLAAAAGAKPEILIQSGDAPLAVCAAAQQFAADLLVIGRGSAAGMFGRLRTNAYAIIRQSPCPVVSV